MVNAMHNRGQRKTPPHTPHGHKKREPSPPTPAQDSKPEFDWERWKTDWKKVDIADKQIKETRTVSKVRPQDKAALAALRLAVTEKFRILRQMYVYQRHTPPDEDGPNSW